MSPRSPGRGPGAPSSRSTRSTCPRVLTATAAAAVVLLNLSRDQLDRTNEVRMVAGRWRAALAAAPHTHVVANADDPLVAWGAGAARDVHWVGSRPALAARCRGLPLLRGPHRVRRGRLVLRGVRLRPARARGQARALGRRRAAAAEWADGRTYPLRLALPGRFNQANALMAAVAAEACGIDAADRARGPWRRCEEVAGRFTVRRHRRRRGRGSCWPRTRPGWDELLDLVAGSDAPLVVSINARVADGADPSWLWDVPFERLAGRTVVATGDRYRDLSVRLHYAGVAHTTEPDPVQAVARAAGGTGAVVDVIGNYTAFHDLLGAPPMSGAAARGGRLPRPARAPTATGATGSILARRAEWRGLTPSCSRRPPTARSPRPTSTASAVARTAHRCGRRGTLVDDGTLARRVAAGAVVLAVCAGFQVVGRSFPGADGEPHEGVGLLDIETVKGGGPRAVGEVVAEPDGRCGGLPVLTGFENHGGRTTLVEGTAGRWRRSPPASATATATAARVRSRATWWGPTCTGRCWPATRRWPTGCCLGAPGRPARAARRHGLGGAARGAAGATPAPMRRPRREGLGSHTASGGQDDLRVARPVPEQAFG